jgi:hypothetical protein
MSAPRHARPSAVRVPVTAIAFTAVAAAAIAVPLTAQHAPTAAKLYTEPVAEDAHVQVAAAPVKAQVIATTSHVMVRAGDTLWGIASSACGNPRDDLALAYNNGITDPNLIRAGQLLKVACHAAEKILAAKYPPPALPASLPVTPQAQTDAVAAVQQPTPSTSETGSSLGDAAVSTSGDGSFQACVIARESGGNPQVTNSTDHYGLYQFSASTWAEYGGNPADFGDASVSEQNQVFDNAVASPGGEGNWSAYDGC